MKLHRLVSAMTAGLVFISAAVVSAQPCQGKGGEPQHRMCADLKLTEEQEGNLKTLHNEMRDIRKKHFEAVKEVRTKIKDELLKKSPSQKTLYKYAGELGKLHEEMSKGHADHLLKVKKILTPEQFKKLVERQDNMKGCKGFIGEGRDGCRHGKGKGCCPREFKKCPHMNEAPPAEDAPPPPEE